jgi:hypothetical protein
MNLFLSHSHGDHELASAIKQLIENCFPGHIEVQASSAAPSEGGIGAGRDWLHWIHNQVRGSKFTAVILTPNSVSKPWLMWEAGAVSGVSLATQKVSTIVPLVYRLSMEQVPSPLRSRQAARGEDRESIKRVLETVQQSVGLPERTFSQFVELFVTSTLRAWLTLLPKHHRPLRNWLYKIGLTGSPTSSKPTDAQKSVNSTEQWSTSSLRATTLPRHHSMSDCIADSVTFTSSRNRPIKRLNNRPCGAVIPSRLLSFA